LIACALNAALTFGIAEFMQANQSHADYHKTLVG
jgi:hypothetical protein